MYRDEEYFQLVKGEENRVEMLEYAFDLLNTICFMTSQNVRVFSEYLESQSELIRNHKSIMEACEENKHILFSLSKYI